MPNGYEIRTAAVTRGVPCITTIPGAAACVQGIEALVRGEVDVRPLQEHHARLEASRAALLAAAPRPTLGVREQVVVPARRPDGAGGTA